MTKQLIWNIKDKFGIIKNYNNYFKIDLDFCIYILYK